MKITRWGIFGPGAIAHNFADGMLEAPSGKLIAIASSDEGRLQSFGNKYKIAGSLRFQSYEALATSPEVDAIYVSVVHPFHAELSVMAMRAGKAVVVEKPAGINALEVTAMAEVAAQENVFFMEAFMYRCHPQIARMLAIIESGELGDIQHIEASFGFVSSFDRQSRLYNNALAGGGILDVGCYPVSAARLIAGAAIGKRFDDPIQVKGIGKIGSSGVDELAYGLLTFASGITAEISCSIRRELDNSIVVHGDKGKITLPNPWVPGRNAGPSDSTITVNGRTEELQHTQQLFAFEAELASRSIAGGLKEAPAPALTASDSIGNSIVLQRWLAEVGYVPYAEIAPSLRRLTRTIPKGRKTIPKAKIDGLALPLSKLVIGCDNKDDVASGAIVWDAWMEAGGNGFDTGFVYGGGNHEKVLGQWINNRKVEKDIVVIVKGGNNPYCLPSAMKAQLEISLDRLQISMAPIYIMHRDNPSIPVGEFVDAMNDLQQAGKIGIYGGSNWSTTRFEAARTYANAKGLKGPSMLNNNLSLAVMMRPVWPGCVASNDVATLNYLRENKFTHLSWSSQARGYFLPEELRNRLPHDTAPETCFGGPENAERRRRAEDLALKYKVSAHNIATAWVLAQEFPSIALVGPRSPGEIVSTLPGLDIGLTHDETKWLNLES
jgi:predicted dehydrogenase/aryl-alcohol dehydrogenase-like predicted oxidoreductase